MEEVLREYGAAIAASAATFGLMGVLGRLLLGNEGLLPVLVLGWL